MSKLDIITHLYEYNEWATNRLFEASAAVPEGELTANRGASSGAILMAFAHLAAAETNWLGRWTTGRNTTPTQELQKMPNMETVRAAFHASHTGLREFVAALTEERLEVDLKTRDSSGHEISRPLWQMMAHVANHGTYHRGEIAAMLTDLGHSPGDIDFLFWEIANHP